MAYNYQHFGPKHYNFKTFKGSKQGERAPDFTAVNLEGEEVQLSDFRGKWIVLETGSITCPITDSKVSAMDELQKQFDDVVFLLLYTREAHPGEHYDAHISFEEKLERARKFAADYDMQRTVLVDDLEGSVHKQYGSMPNSVHVINPEGVVVMRGDWNDVDAVARILERRDVECVHERSFYSGRPLFFTKKKGFLKVLKDAGFQAVWDFFKNAPTFMIMHLKKMFRKLG